MRESQAVLHNVAIEDSQYLVAVVDLFRELNEQGIRYCHWKSNCNLDLSLRGLTDLDLLVDREHGERFRLALAQHGAKPVVTASGSQYPAIEDYVGMDWTTGRLFHLHVHYQLVLGEQFVKGYRLPIEPSLLDNTDTYAGIIKIPSPDVEIIVLAIRALLKYRDRDAIKDALSIRSPGLPVAIRDEIKGLYEQADLERVSGVLQSDLDLLPTQVILSFLSAAVESPRSGALFYRLRKELRRMLEPYQRRGRWRAAVEYSWVLLRRRMTFLPRYSNKKRPVAGGMMIAVLGADGAGKSTVVSELCEWLSWKLDVHRFYLGSQEPSRLSKVAHRVFQLARSAEWRWGRLVGEERATTRALGGLRRSLHYAYHISIARERYLRYVEGRGQAMKGAVVIFDRYPLEALHREMEARPMDGPRIAAEAGDDLRGLALAMSRKEESYYRRIRPPDHLFILHVSPHVSRQRKSDHDQSVIEDKSRALRQMDREGLRLTEIDADQPLEQVLLQIKRTLWDLL